MNKALAASMIDLTLLKAQATPAQILTLCDEAVHFGFATVCINPLHVPLAARRLAGSGVQVCTVIGFPLGANRTEVKVYEAKLAVEQGAHEVDMVIDIGAAKVGDFAAVAEEVRRVNDAIKAAQAGVLLKVILETCLLTDAEKQILCAGLLPTGADFVKTSTGFSTGGATVEDVRLLHQAVGDNMRVKASGGIRSRQALEDMAAAGASRIGTSSGPAILAEYDA